MIALSEKKTKQIEVLKSPAHRLDVDLMAYAFFAGCDYPLTSYDRQTYSELLQEDAPIATMGTSLSSTFSVLTEQYPEVEIETRSKNGSFLVNVKMSHRGALVSSRSKGLDNEMSLEVCLLTAAAEFHGQVSTLDAQLAAVSDILDKVPHGSQWDIEEVEPNLFISVIHDLRICFAPFRSRELAASYAKDIRLTDVNILSLRQRYEARFESAIPTPRGI